LIVRDFVSLGHEKIGASMSSGEVPPTSSLSLTIACPSTGDTVPSGDIYVSGLSSGIADEQNVTVQLWYDGDEMDSNTAKVELNFWSCKLTGTVVGSNYKITAAYDTASDEVTNITIAPSAPMGRGSGGGISGFAASGPPNSQVKIEYSAKNNSEPLLFFLVPEESNTPRKWTMIDKNSHTGSGSAKRPHQAQFATKGKLAENNRVVVYMRDSSGKLTQYTVTRVS
jgi:hypothetical protein